MADLSGDLITLSGDQERLRQVAGSYQGFTAQPGLAVSLARSGATDSQVAAVGGFMRGLELSKQVTLARQSGVLLDLDDSERAALEANGSRYDDVDKRRREQEAAAAAQQGGGGFLGFLNRAANKVTTLPGVRQAFSVLDRAYDITNTVYREATPGAAPRPEDMGQRTADMLAAGYDPTSFLSTLAFVSRGKQVFRSLDEERTEFGTDQVRLAQEFLIDPEGFMSPKLATEELARRDRLRQDPNFKRVVDAVDARRRSPGRDIANAAGFEPGTKPFTVTSGSADAIWAFVADPTLIGGKVRKGAQVLRYGVPDLSDAGRIESLMRGNRQVQRGWQAMLDDAKVMRSGTPEEAAAAYARIHARTPELLPVVDEVHGGGLRHGAPIESYDELVDHVVGHTALLRLSNGLAARETPLMPGAVSRWGASRADRAGRKTERQLTTIDLKKDAAKVVPDEVDGVTPDGLDATGLPDAAAIGDAALAYRKTMRGRIDQLKRKWTLLPEHQFIDLADGAAGAETVRRFAALYMPSGHANALAARFATASIGERRSISEAVYQQVVHAAGIPSTSSGRHWLLDQQVRRTQVENSAYDSSGKNLDVIAGGGEGESVRRAALYDSQTNQHFYLPNYRELRMVAAKVGLWDRVSGVTLEARSVDRVLSAVRTLWLVSGASSIRNSIDNVLSSWHQGNSFREILRARVAMSTVTAQGIVEHAAQKAALEVDDEYGQLARTLHGVFHGSILSGIRRVEAFVGEKFVGEELLTRARELADDQMTGELDDMLALTGLQSGALGRDLDDMRGVLASGYRVSSASIRPAGYELAAPDGNGGAKMWGQQLGLRMSTPLGRKVFRAVTSREHALPGPRGFKAGDIPEADPTSLRDELVDFMLGDEFIEGRALMERFGTLRDGTKVGENPALRRRAAEELADDQIEDMRSLLTGRNGRLIDPVVRELSAGKLPNVKLLQALPEAIRPERVVQPKFVADLSEGNVAANLVQSIGDRAYATVVAKPMDWLSTLPIYHVNYVRAYRQVERHMKAHGGVDESAIRDAARQHAMDLTVRMIDNPGLRTQFALTSRNLFNFYRAQEDFLRRWSRNLRESPENIRKMQLTVEGGMHSGLVYENEDGELVFAYPGSGVAIQTMAKALSAIGLGNAVNLPVIPNLTTKVNFLNAGLDRPFLPTLSPVASIPVRLARHYYADNIKLVQAQEVLEGQISAGRGWWSQALPSPVYRMTAALSSDEREGQYASALRNAVMNAYASGELPENATPSQIQEFKDRIRVGVRNHLAMRALLALVLPGAPNTPSEESDASRTNELERATWNSTSLKDEFRAMSNRYGYQRAIEIWAETRPHQLIYTVSTTEGAGGTGGYLAPTDEVLKWLKDNPELAKKYRTLAAYFAPDGPGDFSSEAWRTELELGLRQHKTLDTFYRDIAVKNAETTYYAARDKRDVALAEAKASGDDDRVRAINETFDTWARELKAANPLLVEKWAEGQARQAKLAASITEIDALVQSSAVEKVDPNGDLGKLLAVYRQKQTFDQTHTGRTNEDKAGKDSVEASYKDFVAVVLERSPYLIPIWRGVFDKVE